MPSGGNSIPLIFNRLRATLGEPVFCRCWLLTPPDRFSPPTRALTKTMPARLNDMGKLLLDRNPAGAPGHPITREKAY
jgi:hypothetical protein